MTIAETSTPSLRTADLPSIDAHAGSVRQPARVTIRLVSITAAVLTLMLAAAGCGNTPILGARHSSQEVRSHR